MAGLSISPNHRPRTVPRVPHPEAPTRARDRWRRLDVLAANKHDATRSGQELGFPGDWDLAANDAAPARSRVDPDPTAHRTEPVPHVRES